MARRLARISTLCLAAAIVSAGAGLAQTLPPTPESPNDYPAPLPPRKGPLPPSMRFRIVSEIPLPGAPTGRGATVDGARLLVPVEGGVAIVSLGPPASAVLAEAGTLLPGADPEWIVSEDGRFRFRSLPEGGIEAQKLGRWFRKWRKEWRLRVPSATIAPPSVRGPRVFFGSADNRVYGVRRKNGHRLWATDLDDRITHPLAIWHGTVEAPVAGKSGPKTQPFDVELVLAIPDGGGSIVGLDAYDGSRLATFEVTADGGMLATAAAVLEDGRIAVARTSYAAGGASLLLFEATVSERTPQTGPK